jgi:hypothetical protein
MTNNSGATWTWSAWIKKTEDVTGDEQIFGTASPVLFCHIRSNNFGWTTASQANQETALRRDPAAWYHRVDISDGTTIRMFINGELTTTWTQASVGINTNVEHFIGGDTARASEFFQGYLADVYFIDGQALEPTAFGRYDHHGVWEPRSVSFANTKMRFSDFLFADNTGNNTNAPNFDSTTPATLAEQAFNGDTSDGADAADSSSTIIYRPENALEGLTGLRVFTEQQARIWVNETLTGIVAGSGSSWIDLGPALTFPLDLTNLALNGSGGAAGRLNAIEVTDADGTRILTNPFIWSAGVTLIGDPGAQFDHPRRNMFDGNTGTNCIGNTSGQTISWVPPTPINYNQSVEIWTPSAPGTNTISLQFEGTETASVPCLENAWTTVDTGSGTFDNLRVFGPGTDARISAVRIDGQIYVDGVNNSFGVNGFHLDFSDPDDLGADRSGNGNDFTATGFGTNPPNNDLLDNFSPTASLPAFNEGQNAMEEPFLFPAMFNGLATAGGGVMVGSDPAIAMSQGGGITATWNGNLSRPIGVDFTLLIYRERDANDVTITGSNGNTVVYTAPSAASTISTHDLTGLLDAQDITEVTSISWTRNGAPTNNGFGIGGIEIDGRRVTVEGSGADYDLMADSPTQNYATMNPLFPYTSFNLQNANLLCDYPNGALNQERGFNTMALGTANAYWEITPVRLSEGMQFGIATQAAFPNSGSLINGSSNSFTVNNGGDILVNGTVSSTGNPSFAVDETVAFTWEGSTGTFAYSVDGANFTNIAIDAAREQFVSVRIGNDSRVSTNFGQQPFIYTPPAGFEALQTQNLTAATIPNGRDHFQAITGPGTGAGTGGRQGSWINDLFSAPPGDRDQAHASTADVFQSGAPKTLAFDGNTGTVAETDQSQGRPGWMSFRPSDTTVPELTASSTFKIKVRRIQELWVNGTQMTGNFTNNSGSLFDLSSQLTFPFTLESLEIGAVSGQDAGLFGIELDGELLTQNGILETAQTTFPNGLWWIKDRVNSNQHQLVDSVRGTTNQTIQNPSGGYENAYSAPSGSSVAWCWKYNSSDVSENGFNIIEFTGADNDPQTIDTGLTNPQFVMYVSDAGSSQVKVQHASYQPGLLELHSDSQGVGYSTCTFSGGNVNIDGALISGSGVMYAWEPVEGFSKFGSYTGNGDADGPFIYTGFSVSLLLVKAVNLSENWMIWDSTRSPSNPTGSAFHPNLTNAEFAGDNYDIDLLSNGFKPRQPSGEMNSASSSYIYAAFAENPFGANNTSPATAR